jgi:lipopolysaccharide export system permease protein
VGNILGRYIFREVLLAWLLVTGVLLVILLAYQVVGVLERAAVNQFPPDVVLQLIYLGALQYLSILLPVGLLLGVVLAFGRLYADSEMAAALACGAGPANIYLPVALLALVAAVGLGSPWCSRPQATQQALSLRQAAIRAGQFAPSWRASNGVCAGCEPRRHAAKGLRGAQPRAAGAGRPREARPPLGDPRRSDTHSYTLRRGTLRRGAGEC